MIPLGIQDDGIAPAEVISAGASLRAQWVRIITVPGDHTQPIADRIRDAHDAGLKVILTVGGNGTSAKHVGVRAALRWIDRLPRTERVTVWNEADLSGPTPCVYRRGWMRMRRTLGRRLLWGDFSSYNPLSFTQRARACGRLPRALDFALHPYCSDDPLSAPHAGSDWEGCMNQLVPARRWLRRNAGVSVRWWLTEFGYDHDVSDARQAWLWPRAIAQANRVQARALVIYTAQGPTWDTRPKQGAWCVLTQGRDCPAGELENHRVPDGDPPPAPRGADPIFNAIDNYTNGGA
jgi:hypothetical protein